VDLTIVVHVDGPVADAVACLGAVADTVPPGIDYEVVVVDDATSDDTAAFLTCLEGDVVVWRTDEPVGFAAAANRGAAAARAPVLVFLRSATVPSPGWVEDLLASLASPGVGAAQVRISNPDGTLHDAGGMVGPDATAWLRGAGSPVPDDPCFGARVPDFLTTACLAVRAEAFAAAGGFDTAMPDGIYADAAFSFAVRRAGWALACTGRVGATWRGGRRPAAGWSRFAVCWGEAARATSGRRRPLAVAFYLPQFHPVPENDRAWGPGFTEWTNVARARPAFDGHEQPHLPADLGFYDLRLPETREAQAALARRHGVDAFCWYHYWFSGRRLLNRPLDEMLASGRPDLPFCLCWANEDWRANWDGRSGEVLVAQRYSPDDDLAHIRWLIEVFRDPRYLRVDGRPLFAIYRAARLPDVRRTLAVWRDEARRAGIGELYLCRVESFDDELGDPRALGFDASVEFAPDWRAIGPPVADAGSHAVHDYGALVRAMLAKPRPAWRRIPCVTPRWDNTPRRAAGGLVFTGSTPESYGGWLATVAERELAAGEPSPMVFVNAWNEWGEGAHLEPCQRWGRAFLEAHREAIGAGPPPPGPSHPGLSVNADRLAAAEAAAEAAADAGEAARALAIARAGADAVWYAHPGRFTSPRLELVCDRVGRALPWPARPQGRRDRPRVLHVLSEAHRQGGHTRLAWRWIAADAGRDHAVALTAQDGLPVPPELTAVATVTDLGAAGARGPLDRLVALRELAAGADVVVLHVHPYDAVAVAALAGERPPTIFVNHAGHVFWLGTGVADVVACLRESTARLAVSRRGVDPERVVLLPSPLRLPARRPRAEAKRQLGLPPDAVVALTMASPYKYAPAGDLGFLELAVPAVAEIPEAVLVAVGPERSGPWAEAAGITGGRVLAVGRHDDPSPFLEAADVYLDSWPLPSTTSFLEAATYGVPVLAFRPAALAGTPLAADDPGLGELLVAAETPSRWRDAFARLVRDHHERVSLGSRSATAVVRAHTGHGWLARLEALYERVTAVPRAAPPVVTTPPGEADLLDERILTLHENGGMVGPARTAPPSPPSAPAPRDGTGRPVAAGAR
jgi:glycosyltransferase involved in cell wall biosynthesis